MDKVCFGKCSLAGAVGMEIGRRGESEDNWERYPTAVESIFGKILGRTEVENFPPMNIMLTNCDQ